MLQFGSPESSRARRVESSLSTQVLSDGSRLHKEEYVDNSGDMTHIVNHDRISNQAATQHFHAPVYLSVFLTISFQQDAADISSSIT